MDPSKIAVGKAFRFRSAMDQRLRLRGGRDFSSVEDYCGFLKLLTAERNAERRLRLTEELQAMRRLPLRWVDAFREEWVTVSRWSTVRVAHNVYWVSSRLIGYRVQARIHAASIELEYGGQTIERMERLRGNNHGRIDYRHLHHSLLRNPGAFERYMYREALFPTVVFRKAYDRLMQSSKKWADLGSGVRADFAFGRYHA